VQQLHSPLLARGQTQSFGGIPGDGEPYGFVSFDAGGAIYTVVNPAQSVRAINLTPLKGRVEGGRVLFRMPDLSRC
jgi:hypothetical protein